MKILTFFLATFLIILSPCIAQNFKFTDTTFSVGDKMTRGQLYNPDCHIDNTSFAFIDSLAKFLLVNRQIAIQIDFHSDIRGNDKFLMNQTEVCGQLRLESYFKYKYPDIKFDRIQFCCYGNSQPIYSQIDIDKITNEDAKIKAHAANRRTVIIITQIN